MGIRSKLFVMCFAALLSGSLMGYGIRGPKGADGPRGPRGEIGEAGDQGPDEKFPPAYATAYLDYDTPEIDRAVRTDAGEQIVPFISLGDHSTSTSLNCSTHEISLPSGIYKVSFQFNLIRHEPTVMADRPVISSIYMTLIPSVGTPSLHPIDFVRSEGYYKSGRPELHYEGYPYQGEGIVAIPDGIAYKATLSFRKEDAHTYYFGDTAVSEAMTPCPCANLNNYARITLIKIAEYQQP